MARFAKLSIGAGCEFTPDSLPADVRRAIEDGRADAWQAYDALKPNVTAGKVRTADMVGTREFEQNNYLYRFAVAVDGIYGNSKEEAMYAVYFVDSTGTKMDGSRRYQLRFAPGQSPPVNAFSSLTLYELPASLLSDNPLNRYLINSPMLSALKKDADGGVTIYVQHDSPGTDRESNWLPAPAGPFWVALRLYSPKQEALNGTWKQPPSRPAAVARDPVPSFATRARARAYGWFVDQLMVRMRQSSESRVSTMSCVLMYFSGLPSSYSAREMTQAVSLPWNVTRSGPLSALT
jgi:hypothetical protein